MLCPGCGTSVGEKLQYCENCKSLQQVTQIKPQEEQNLEAENQTAEASLQEVFEEVSNPNIKIVERLFFGLIFIAVILAVATIVYYRKDTSSKPVIPEIEMIAHDPSSFIFAGKKVELLSNIARYDSRNQILEIAFFDGNLSGLNEDSLKSLDSLVNIPNSKPDVVLSFKFNNAKDCNMANVSQAKVVILGIDKSSEVTTVPIEFNSSFDLNSATAFGTLNCSFQGKENLTGQFKIALKLEELAEAGSALTFDLKSKVKISIK